MNDMNKGLYSKYNVTKADGTPLDGDCFVLRPDRDAAAVKALLAYAASTPNEELSSDIRIWLASIGADMNAPDEIAVIRAEVEQYKADIEAGRLVRYPCRPGDMVWTLWRDTPEMTVHSESVAAMLDTGEGPVPCRDYGCDGFGAISGCFDSPQPYYLTQDEAEAARAALRQEGTEPDLPEGFSDPKRQRSGCNCATYDEDSGRYDCSVSGDGCMYYRPNAKRCAREFGEGPLRDVIPEDGADALGEVGPR